MRNRGDAYIGRATTSLSFIHKMDTDFLKRLAINLLSTSMKSQKWNSAKCNFLVFILVATRKNIFKDYYYADIAIRVQKILTFRQYTK